MRLQFVMCGNHTDAFLSQAAMFRLMLDSYGGDHGRAQLVLCVGGPEEKLLPERWRKPFERIDVRWVSREAYRRDGDLAQSLLTYNAIDATSDLAVICDADTVLLRPLPGDFLEAMAHEPALAGCIAHYQPPLTDNRVPAPPAIRSIDELWQRLSMNILGREIPAPYRYTLRKRPEDVPGTCPFYINLGFLASTPALLKSYGIAHSQVLPKVRAIIENDFYEQLAVPFAAERAGLPTRVLPIRFNLPNDPIAERLYPEEAESVVLLHYLRKNFFDRHSIFTSPENFARFIAMPLGGTNAAFQKKVRDITRDKYPF